MKVIKYSSTDKIVWNEFVKLSKNSHFFFERDYLEYHSDRFFDFSLIICDDKNSIVALLPANLDGDVVYTHQGLTFGGLIIKSSMKQNIMLEVVGSVLGYCKELGYKKMVYKAIPSIYHQIPSSEDLYALFRHKFKLVRRDVSSAIFLDNQIKYSKGRKWLLKKSKNQNISVQESSDIKDFWLSLEAVLNKGHSAKPVHSLDEIIYLKEKFSKNIKFYTALKNDIQIAGAVIFETETVAHTQYLYNTDLGRELGALDLLIDNLVKEVYTGKVFFDFGTSNEQNGDILNEGLISQKEGFGARAICHDFYEVEL